MKKTGLIILSVFVLGKVQAQEYRDSTFNKFQKNKQLHAQDEIVKLKEGALIVLLAKKTKSIEAYRSKGFEAQARKIESEQHYINSMLYKAFQKSYTFSKVYFAWAEDLEKIKNGERSSVFLDSNLNIIPGAPMNEDYFLIAEYGDLYSTSVGFADTATMQKQYEKGEVMRKNTIVVKNVYRLQLKRPFPYYQTSHKPKNLHWKIRKWNKRLEEYHKKVMAMRKNGTT